MFGHFEYITFFCRLEFISQQSKGGVSVCSGQVSTFPIDRVNRRGQRRRRGNVFIVCVCVCECVCASLNIIKHKRIKISQIFAFKSITICLFHRSLNNFISTQQGEIMAKKSMAPEWKPIP